MKKEKRYAVRLTCCRQIAARYTAQQVEHLLEGHAVAPLTCPKCCAQFGVGRGAPSWYSDDYADYREATDA